MPVVPPPPPEKPPTPDVEQFSLSFPPVPLSLYIGCLSSIYLSIRSSPSRTFPSRSLCLSRLVDPPPLPLPPLLPTPTLSLPRHHVVALGYVTMLPT